MHALPFLLIICAAALAPAESTTSAAAHLPGQPSALIVADESVRFDRDFRPLYSPNQLLNSAEATRLGLERWAATEHGRAVLRRLNAQEYVVMVTENDQEPSPGRAPQPGLATLASFGEHSRLKVYDLVLNPSVFRPIRATVSVVPPSTPAEMMALAWAAEMLHIDFYARGISLPHHRRDDFQREWAAVATELGMPRVRHDDGDDDDPAATTTPDWRARARPRRGN